MNYTKRHDLVLFLGKPRAGLCYTDMCQSRLGFKSYQNIVNAMKIPYALTHLPNLICKKTYTHSEKTLSM